MHKRPSILLACLALTISACLLLQPPFRPTPISPTPALITWDERSLFRDGLVSAAQAVLDGLPGATVYHLDLTIAGDLVHITGTEEALYTNRESVALDEIQFRLFPNLLGGNLTIASVTVNGEAVTASYSLNNSLMRVPLDPPLQPAEQARVHIEFTVSVPTKAGSNYGIFAYTHGVLSLAHAYPMIAVYNHEGWNAEIPPEHGDIVFTDASFFLVRVNAPQALVIAASGREVDREEAGGRQQVTYALGPARDFYLAASADYTVISKTVGEVTVNSYAAADRAASARLALDVAAAAIQDFSQHYAPYPYTEFDIVAIPTYALGIEFPGMTGISQDLYGAAVALRDTPASIYLESTVAHEVGHQWFYNLVGSDQLDEPWLDESLTQYITWQYYKDIHGQSGGRAFEEALEARWEGIERAEMPIGLPVREYDGLEYSAIIYGRGAFFFEALAGVMREEAFDQFLRDYVQTHAWGIATTEDIKSLAEQHCGCELTLLFQEWVYPAGYQPPSAPPPTIPSSPILSGCPIFPADNIRNMRVDNLPVHPLSKAYIEINHALRFTARRTQAAYLWPARQFPSEISDANVPPMGARF